MIQEPSGCCGDFFSTARAQGKAALNATDSAGRTGAIHRCGTKSNGSGTTWTPACTGGHILALVISVVTSALLLVNPALTKRLVDDVLMAQNPEPLLGILAVMLVVKLGREGARYFMIVTLEKNSQNVVYNLRMKLFTKLQYNDVRFFDRHRAGDLMTRLSADLDWCRHFVGYIDYRVIDSLCIFLFTCVYLLCVNWQLTLMLVVVTPVLMAITKLYSSRVRPRFVAMRDRLAEMNTAAQENIAGNRVVKAFAREDYEKERFDERNQAFMRSNLRINELWLKFYPFIELLANAMMLITVFVGGLFIINGADDAGRSGGVHRAELGAVQPDARAGQPAQRPAALLHLRGEGAGAVLRPPPDRRRARRRRPRPRDGQDRVPPRRLPL